MFPFQPDAHQFVVTARVRATETLARTGIGRVCTIDECRPPTTITFDYPPKFQHLMPSEQYDKHRSAGLTARSVSFSTIPGSQGRTYGYVVFSDEQKTQKFTLRPEMGADNLAHQVVEFMATGKSPTFASEIIVSSA
jgi:hypothetical protein